MTIKVRFFAALRESLGTDSLDIASSANTDLIGVLEHIREKLGDAAVEALCSPDIRVALNREFIVGECVVTDGDEIAFMPPITGG